MPKTIALMLAEGFEDIEAIAALDIFRRLGLDVKTVALDTINVTSAHNLTVKADYTLESFDITSCDALVLPGGLPGATNLRDSEILINAIRKMYAEGKILAAICAAPIVLETAGVIEGRRVTGYPTCEKLANSPTLAFSGAIVEHHDNIITGKGPGAVFAFASEIAKALGVPDENIKQLFAGMFLL